MPSAARTQMFLASPLLAGSAWVAVSVRSGAFVMQMLCEAEDSRQSRDGTCGEMKRDNVGAARRVTRVACLSGEKRCTSQIAVFVQLLW